MAREDKLKVNVLELGEREMYCVWVPYSQKELQKCAGQGFIV
jgi:hypothetical protein